MTTVTTKQLRAEAKKKGCRLAEERDWCFKCWCPNNNPNGGAWAINVWWLRSGISRDTAKKVMLAALRALPKAKKARKA